MFIDIDEMFFDYCILLGRTAEEFWNSRPSQILFCIEKYEDMMNKKSGSSDSVGTITSMREIGGWGDKA